PSESDVECEINELLDKEEVDEPYPADETKESPQSDYTLEPMHPSESGVRDETNELLDKEEVDEPYPEDESKDTFQINNYGQGKVFFMNKKSPFSIHVEIDDFLHAPICGDIVQNTFEFLDQNTKQTPEFETKLINTTSYYPEQPDCRLVCSKIHELVSLTVNQNEGRHNKGYHYQSVVVPVHDSLLTEAEESNNNSCVHIRVPVVLGEYKIEVCLEENVTFREEVIGINEVSKEIVLSNFRLVPTVLSQPLKNGTRTVLKGKLLLEGYICQKIEYAAIPNKNTDSLNPLKQLNQKMAVELIIHIQQVQQVRVKK
ncbi:BC_2427 family protein, partial [Actinomycetes bacterium NPDC127524]